PAGGKPGRTGAYARRRDAVVELKGNADALLRRRDRDASSGDRAGAGARSLREERSGDRRRPRRLPHPDAMGCDALRGLLDIHAVAAAGGRFSPRKRGQSRRRRRLDPEPLQGADRLAKKIATTRVWRLSAG